MKKLNINITEEFKRDLDFLIKERGFANKAEALRQALREAVAAVRSKGHTGFQDWLGLGLKSPLRKQSRFASEDDLWS